MTYREILLSLEVGQSYDFHDTDKAANAMSRANKLYDFDRKFRRSGTTVVRVS